jgi:hypothetical protein
MSEIHSKAGRIGGLVKSKAKREAARRNGKLGGRPKADSVDKLRAIQKHLVTPYEVPNPE